MTTLINLRKTKIYHYKIDRDTEYGNQYKIGVHGDRIKCVSLYKDYFHNRILTDQNFLNKILQMKDQILACWCVPDLCHGHVIIDFLDGTNEFEKRTKNIDSSIKFFD